jgi:hypothetical protein
MHTISHTFEALPDVLQGGTGMIAHRAFVVERGTNFTEDNAEITQARQATTEERHSLALHLPITAQALEDFQTLRYIEKLHTFEVKTSNLRRLKIRTYIDHGRQWGVCPDGKRRRHF